MECEKEVEKGEKSDEFELSEPKEISVQDALAAELEESRKEVGRLSTVIRERERADREAAAFSELFPEVTLDEVPDEVRRTAQVEEIPLVAAYALFDRRKTMALSDAERCAKRAAEVSAGAIFGSSGEEPIFTLDQIRAMSPKEVRRNYKSILKSLCK